MDKLIRDTQDAHPGITSIVISHDMRAVLAIADKIVLLHAGRVAHEGTPAYFRESDDPFIRQFLEGSLEGPMQV
jgi:phospholipid/cholesterol/gamma-HCH transport system ATP-binding protein